MHAKTEINAAKILSLLYHSTPSCGVFKIFKKFEKILGKIPRKTKLSGIITTKILSLLRVPRKIK